MSSRFAKSYVCLNGPKEGDYIDAPPGVEVGSAVALPWFDAKHIIRYAVYILTEHEGTVGLMFLQSHEKAEKAQQHVHRITTVVQAAHLAASQPN